MDTYTIKTSIMQALNWLPLNVPYSFHYSRKMLLTFSLKNSSLRAFLTPEFVVYEGSKKIEFELPL